MEDWSQMFYGRINLLKIKLGSTRRVFIFKTFVIKIPNTKEYRLFLYGLLANTQEKVFSSLKRCDLAKVKFCDKLGLILIMEKTEEIEENIDWLKFKEDLEEKYKNDNMKEFMLSDAKPTNWGYIGNR